MKKSKAKPKATKQTRDAASKAASTLLTMLKRDRVSMWVTWFSKSGSYQSRRIDRIVGKVSGSTLSQDEVKGPRKAK